MKASFGIMTVATHNAGVTGEINVRLNSVQI